MAGFVADAALAIPSSSISGRRDDAPIMVSKYPLLLPAVNYLRALASPLDEEEADFLGRICVSTRLENHFRRVSQRVMVDTRSFHLEIKAAARTKTR